MLIFISNKILIVKVIRAENKYIGFKLNMKIAPRNAIHIKVITINGWDEIPVQWKEKT